MFSFHIFVSIDKINCWNKLMLISCGNFQDEQNIWRMFWNVKAPKSFRIEANKMKNILKFLISFKFIKKRKFTSKKFEQRIFTWIPLKLQNFHRFYAWFRLWVRWTIWDKEFSIDVIYKGNLSKCMIISYDF